MRHTFDSEYSNSEYTFDLNAPGNISWKSYEESRYCVLDKIRYTCIVLI